MFNIAFPKNPTNLTMKTPILSLLLLLICSFAFAQIDKEQLALEVSKVDAANLDGLKSFIWKRKTDVMINGELKLTTLTEFSFDDEGKLQAKMVDAETTVKDKRGIRGRMQDKAIEDNMDYVEKGLGMALSYTFMSKGWVKGRDAVFL